MGDREAAEGVELDLADALPRQAEPTADLLERAGLVAVDPVPKRHDLPLAVGKRQQRVEEDLPPELHVDLLLGKRLVAGDEIAERRVLVLRFGLDGSSGRTLEQVGVELGITRERVRQLETRALRELRHAAPALELYIRA